MGRACARHRLATLPQAIFTRGVETASGLWYVIVLRNVSVPNSLQKYIEQNWAVYGAQNVGEACHVKHWPRVYRRYLIQFLNWLGLEWNYKATTSARSCVDNRRENIWKEKLVHSGNLHFSVENEKGRGLTARFFGLCTGSCTTGCPKKTVDSKSS